MCNFMDSLGYAWGDAKKPLHELMKENEMAKKNTIVTKVDPDVTKERLTELDDLIAGVSQKAVGKPKPKPKTAPMTKPLTVKRKIDKR